MKFILAKTLSLTNKLNKAANNYKTINKKLETRDKKPETRNLKRRKSFVRQARNKK
jgi:hypothetical protein